MGKVIKFLAQNPKVFELEDSPVPAKQHSPNWYKKTKKYHGAAGNESNSIVEKVKSENTISPMEMTYKNCTPFIDAMTMGYTITLPATIIVTQQIIDNEMKPVVHWQTDWAIVDSPSQETAINFPIPSGCSGNLFRWLNNWKIETPKGYSALITHPIHRNDLPFVTLTGVIDTDKHINPVVLPFFFKEGFEGEIPVGTPIAQIIPVKRDNWKSLKEISSELYGVNKIKIPFTRAYKTMWWTKKNYT
jgi:hypothetical protein